MTRGVVALVVSVSMLAGCFPHSARNRRIAQLGEGAAILAGIGISAFANTTADCDNMNSMPGTNPGDSCESNAKWATTAGVILIVSGLMGFVATVSTAEDDDAKPKPVEIKDVTEAKPAEKAPAETPAKSEGSASEPMAGSAAPAPAPQQ